MINPSVSVGERERNPTVFGVRLLSVEQPSTRQTMVWIVYCVYVAKLYKLLSRAIRYT